MQTAQIWTPRADRQLRRAHAILGALIGIADGAASNGTAPARKRRRKARAAKPVTRRRKATVEARPAQEEVPF